MARESCLHPGPKSCRARFPRRPHSLRTGSTPRAQRTAAAHRRISTEPPIMAARRISGSCTRLTPARRRPRSPRCRPGRQLHIGWPAAPRDGCAQAAKDTARLIEESTSLSLQGTTKVSLMTPAIREITCSAREAQGCINQASGEQSQGMAQISKALSQIDQVTQKTAKHCRRQCRLWGGTEHTIARAYARGR